MKLSIFIDKEREEEVVIYAHEKNDLIKEIEALVTGAVALFGYTDNEAIKINPAEIDCFTVENNKVFAFTSNQKYRLRERLYQLEALLPEYFIKINQSCIANINKIQKFDVSVAGSLTVVFKSGYRDYVSRRNIKFVKERLGL